ncbi:MAG: ABC transporter permease [Halioglobus sp.]|nr:ABC transporter permease [Halioglobus sp.]
MTFIEQWRQILLSAFRHRTRTLLTAFGVFWGIFMLVLLLGIGKGLERGVQSMFKDEAVNSVWVRAGTTSLAYQGYTIGRAVTFSTEDIAAVQQAIPGATSITPRHTVPLSRAVSSTTGYGFFPVLGIYPGYHTIERNRIIHGRFINALDIDHRRLIAVLGRRSAELLFGNPAHAIGEFIILDGISFQVVGVFDDDGGESELRRIYLPFTSLARSLDPSREFGLLVFVTSEKLEPQWLEQRLREVLAVRHQFDPTDLAAVSVFNANEQFKKIEAMFTGINFFITVVGLGTLFAGLVSVSNIMMISVKERKREIGLRKAVGATPRSIQLLVMKEALLIATISGYLGLVVGLAVIETIRLSGLEAEFFRDPEVNLLAALAALIAIIFGGTLAGLIPARQAAKTNPIEALRHD